MRKMVKCEICKKRESVLTYSSEPMLTLTHGWGGQELCRQCFINKIKNHIKDCEKQLKEQEELLKNELDN
jgi:hypothetical protein